MKGIIKLFINEKLMYEGEYLFSIQRKQVMSNLFATYNLSCKNYYWQITPPENLVNIKDFETVKLKQAIL